MSLGSVKIVKKPPSIQVQRKIITDEISKQLQPVGRQHINERKRVVANFDTKIEFDYAIRTINTGEPTVTLSVVLKNSDEGLPDSDWTVGDLWQALDSEGTPPHDITPKDANGFLVFTWGGPGSYDAKTKPIARFGGSGEVRNGEKTVKKRVSHPGFPPRKFSDSINKRLRRQYDQAIDRGVRLGFQKIEKS